MSYPAPAPMPYPAGPPAIPYAREYPGPRRVLTLVLKGSGWMRSPSVNVGIDGTQYPSNFGVTAFEIPADRPVSLTIVEPIVYGRGYGYEIGNTNFATVSMSGGSQAGVATTVIPPGPSLTLEYQAPAFADMPGSIGAPGTTRQHGAAGRAGTLGCAIAMLLGVLPFGIFVLWLLTQIM